MMRTALILAALTTVVACKKKEPEPAAAPAPEAPKVKWTVEMPDGAKPLAEKLVDNGLQGLNPTGSSDFTLKIDFTPEGTWKGKGHVEVGGETLDCQEAGTWKIDEIRDDGQGLLQWNINRTNCPNRESGSVDRVLVGFEGKVATISFR